MRYVRQAGSDPSFLLKAMSEASGELRQTLYGVRLGMLLAPAPPPDEDWCLMGIAFHMQDVEAKVQKQIEALLRGYEPEIPHVDLDDIPFREDYDDADEEELLEEFHYLRRRTAYALWDASEREWERAGIHPYRGRVTLTQIVRDLYQHDLEHMWQARRILDRFAELSH